MSGRALVKSASKYQSFPLLDQKHIDSLRVPSDLEEEGSFSEFIQNFLDVSKKDVKNLTSAVEKKNQKAIESAAHSLRNEAAMLLTHRLLEVTKDLEAASKGKDWESILLIYTQLLSIFKLTFDAVEKVKR